MAGGPTPPGANKELILLINNVLAAGRVPLVGDRLADGVRAGLAAAAQL